VIEWIQVIKADIARLDRMSAAEKFRYWCLKLVDVPYIWGAENFNDYSDNQATMAVFYGQNKMTHVTPVVGRYVILDAVNINDPARLKTTKSVREWYEQRGYKAEWRQIDWDKIKELSKLDKSSWDVDPALKLLRGV